MQKVTRYAALALATFITVAPSRAGDWSVVAHEWGTFTTVAQPGGRSATWIPLGGPVDLPCFVNVFGAGDPVTQLKGKVAGLVIRGGNGQYLTYDQARARIRARVRMETPVIYFYSPSAEVVDVKVNFPQGLFTEWYPNASVTQPPPSETIASSTTSSASSTMSMLWKNVQLPGGLRAPMPMPTYDWLVSYAGRASTSVMEWKGVQLRPGAAESYPVGNHPSHYYPARETDAVPLVVDQQNEKFLFYRGVADFEVPITAVEDSNRNIVVGNTGNAAIPAVILFENRDGKVGFRVHGSLTGTAVIKPVELRNNMAQLEKELESVLVSSGLFKREAQAMVKTWKDSWFEEGARLFYIMPTSAVDAVLPLSITPRPAKVVRTFVGRVELITRETLNRVEKAINSEDEAMLVAYGRFLGPITDQLTANASERERTFTRKYVEELYAAYVKRMEASCR